MVKEIGELLNLPNLEEDTVKLVNEVLRDILRTYKRDSPNDTTADPFKMAQEQAKNVLGADVFTEWVNGKEGE